MNFMKLLRFILPLVLIVSFTSCAINEKINIRKDGSGTLSTNMDMGQMLGQILNLMPKEELEKRGVGSKVDTTVQMKDIMDTLSALSPDKKALMSKGTVHINIDTAKKICKINMQFPFASQADLQKLYAALADGSIGATQLLKDMGSGDDASMNAAGSPDMNMIGRIYNLSCQDGSLIKTVDSAKWNKLKDYPQLGQMKQAEMMMGPIDYTITIILPRPAKSVYNPLAKLSDDKMTITIKTDLTDAIDHPEQLAFNVKY
jgi:hypothetical protein